ncbi:MAG TPA: isochorismatase family protein [Actinocatenispora sp.]
MLASTTVQVLLAELQEDILPISATNKPGAIRRSAAALATVCDLLDIPVTLAAAPRPGGPVIIEELRHLGAPLLRNGPACWDDETLRRTIIEHDRHTLVIGGVTSEIVVLHTALDALAAGHDVQVLADVSGGLSRRTEEAAYRQIEAAGGRITSVPSLVSDMVRDFTTPTGGRAIAALHAAIA